MARRNPRLSHVLVAGALTLVGACAQRADVSPLAVETPSSTASTSSTTTTPPPTTTTTAAPTTTTAAPIDVFALRPPAAAGDPGGLVQQIVAAETALRDPATSEEALATAALLQQVAYRQLGVHPEWDAPVQAALPEGLRGVAGWNAAARREFRAMHTKPATTMPAWHIVAPAPVEVLMAAYQEAEAAFGISWRYLAAINLVETGLGRIRGTSTAGAQGPMQFMPATWAAYGGGGDINDTHDAIMGAARYLAANNGATDIDNALYRYSHSDHYVAGVRLYADLMAEHPRAFVAYYHWGVWYATAHGDIYLPVGYEEPAPVPVTDYLARP
ncbi:MAG: transglycosylase SLT domain-containing protein [Acidimicrobiales bacterium]